MPEMDLDVASGCLDHEDIWARILAYVFWPEDEERRRAYVASVFAHALAALQRITPEETIEWLTAGERSELEELTEGNGELFWRATFEPAVSEMTAGATTDFHELAGGFEALLSALPGFGPGMDEVRIEEVLTAATILDIVRTIVEQRPEDKGEGSVNKAVYILEKTGRRYGRLRSRTPIMEAWRKYKNVSHLTCALYYCARTFPADNRIKQIRCLLSVARDYQKFATTYFPSGRTEPLLDSAEIWAVPDDLTLPDCHIPQDPLPADMTAALREYEAPKQDRRLRRS
jgi:hypothetical protein